MSWSLPNATVLALAPVLRSERARWQCGKLHEGAIALLVVGDAAYPCLYWLPGVGQAENWTLSFDLD